MLKNSKILILEMRTYFYEHTLFPDLDSINIEELNRRLEVLNIKMEFIIGDGLEFTYDPGELDVRNVPCDISFYNKIGNLVLNIVENFDTLDFYTSLDINSEPYFKVPILTV